VRPSYKFRIPDSHLPMLSVMRCTHAVIGEFYYNSKMGREGIDASCGCSQEAEEGVGNSDNGLKVG
jgi:hypothetical protein